MRMTRAVLPHMRAQRSVALLRRIVPARLFDKSIRKLNRMAG